MPVGNYPVVSDWGKEVYKEYGELSARDILRERLIDLLADPEQDLVVEDEGTRTRTRVWDTYRNISKRLGYSEAYIQQNFNRSERYEIEYEALRIRRTRYAHALKKVDDAVLERGAMGDIPAAKLAYQRFEGWSEKHTLAGDKDNPLYLSVVEALDDVEQSGRSLPSSRQDAAQAVELSE